MQAGFGTKYNLAGPFGEVADLYGYPPKANRFPNFSSPLVANSQPSFTLSIMSVPTLADMATWPHPNYVDPVTVVPALKGVMATFTVLMLPFVATRVQMRMRSKGKLGMDDYIIMFAAVCALSIVYLKLTVAGSQRGVHYSCYNHNQVWCRLPYLGCEARMGANLQKGMKSSRSILPLTRLDRSRRGCHVYCRCCIAQDLSLLHLSITLPVKTQRCLLLDNDCRPHLLCDQHRFGYHFPVPVRCP
jgi:hypothetical protein